MQSILIVFCLLSKGLIANDQRIDDVFNTIKKSILYNHQIFSEEEWEKIHWEIVKDENLIAEYDGQFAIHIGHTLFSKCSEFGINANAILAHIITHEFVHILEHKSYYRIQHKIETAQEIVADYDGVLIAYMAGYEVSNKENITFFLNKNLAQSDNNNPTGRIENMAHCLEEIERICIVYKASQLMYAQKEYDQCIKYLNLVKPSLRNTYILKLINKNIAICYIQKAIESF
ncbi:MAG: hypothetical protein IPK03_05440 [Bacteroidetes bacterium]|nr:hypothetical protein [Bacteroidota bacterium]